MGTSQVVPRRAAVVHKVKRLVALSVACLTVVGLTACGRGGELPANAVAQVGETTITKATLDHWIVALFGEYYYEKGAGVAPRGLIADPPGYTTCLAALEAIASGGKNGQARPGAAELQRKCQQLNQGMTQQAMTYLISLQWSAGQAAAYGVKITADEVKQKFARVKAEQFPTEADLQTYLANKGWTLSDELFALRRELLSAKLLKRLAKSGQALAPLLKKLTATTNCRPGYVVEQCKQYRAPKTTSTDPSVATLIEEIATLERAAQPASNQSVEHDEICNNGPGGKGYTCVPEPMPRRHGK